MALSTYYRVVVRFLDGSVEEFEKANEREAGILAAFAAGSPSVGFVSFERVAL